MFFFVAGQIAAALVGLGFLAIGVHAIALPHQASAGYGVAVDAGDRVARAFAAAAGWRDVAAGTAVLAVLAAADPAALGLVLAAMTLIPLGDVVVLARHGVRRPLPYLPHVGGFAAVAAVAVTVLVTA